MPFVGTALLIASGGVYLSDRLDQGYWQSPAPTASSPSAERATPGLKTVPFLTSTVHGVTWAGLVPPPRPKPKKRAKPKPLAKSEPRLVAARSTPLERKVDGLLEESLSEQAVELDDPLEALTDEGLMEEAVAWHRAVGWGGAPEESSSVQPYLETLGEFERNDFSHLKAPVIQAKLELDQLEIRPEPVPPAPKPEPTLVRPAKKLAKKSVPAQPKKLSPSPKSVAPSPVLAEAKPSPANEPTLVRPARTSAPQAEVSTLPEVEEREPVLEAAVEVEPTLEVAREEREPELVASNAVARSVDVPRDEPQLVRPKEPTTTEPTLVVSAPKVAKLPVLAPSTPSPSKWKAVAKRTTPAPSPAPAPAQSAGSYGLTAASASAPGRISGVDRVFGKLTWDEAVGQWLDEKKGHVELSLHPVDSANSQDAVFIPYRYPESNFEVNLAGSVSRYRLVASVFVPRRAAPVVRVPFDSLVGPDNFRTQVKFHLTQAAVAQFRRPAATRHGRDLVLTVFEGGTGRVKDAQPVKGAAVQVIGFPEYGVRLADAQGNVRLEKVPSHSEFLVRLSSPGYYPAYTIVPVLGTNAYLPVYLVPKKRVKAINDFRYLVSPIKNKSTEGLEVNNPLSQDGRKGFVMGRSYHPVRRRPLAGESYGLTFRKSPALYFGALPSPDLRETTDSGMFAFFNVTPSFRAIQRETAGGLRRPVSLLKVRPGTGQYVEFGRGGLRDLEARIWDPYQQSAPAAKVRLVGDTAPRVETDGAGKVLFEDLDFGPGVVTVEVESEGYPITWHTIPWNPANPASLHNLFVMEKDLLRESAKRFAEVQMSREGGAIVGGAESTFFKDRSCVKVKLMTDDGRKVESGFGPFPLSEKSVTGEPLCLTRSKPGFTFFNLPGGEYVLRWEDEKENALRTHVIHVGTNRVSVVVN